jgi:hypothetical protein
MLQKDIFEEKIRMYKRGREVHNEKLHNLNSSPDIIRLITSRWIWKGHGGDIKFNMELTSKILEKCSRKWENDIKMFFQRKRIVDVSWIFTWLCIASIGELGL